MTKLKIHAASSFPCPFAQQDCSCVSWSVFGGRDLCAKTAFPRNPSQGVQENRLIVIRLVGVLFSQVILS